MSCTKSERAFSAFWASAGLRPSLLLGLPLGQLLLEPKVQVLIQTGGLLLAMFNLAHIAEEYFISRSTIDVKYLKENHSDFALVLDINDGQLPNTSDLAYKQVPVHNLQVGSYILVGAGESVPVDCEVSQGTATITIEHLTGEIKPLETEVGDRVPGGARNLDGRIIVKATKTWKESTLSRIVQLTEEAQLNKPKL